MWGFAIIEGFKNLIRSRYTGLITTLSMIVSILLVSAVSTAAYSVRVKLRQLQNETSVMVFFDLSMNEQKARKLTDSIRTLNFVDEIQFISKEAGLKEYYKQANKQQDVTEIVGYNPLPHTAMLMIRNQRLSAANLNQLKTDIKKLDAKADIVVKTEEIQKRSRYIDYMIQAGAAVALIIISITIVLIFNTIRLSIHSKQDIIKTMRLVGAKDSLIKRPFIVEAMIQSLFSAGIVIAITFYGMEWLNKNISLIQSLLGRDLIYHRFHFYALVVLALIMALIGSWLSIRKYLKIRIKRPR